MINRLHSWMHRPEKGWDPVPHGYSQQYANHEWASGTQEKLLDDLEARIGGFAGKSVLDLGGGPGHYSVAFAKRGAQVTWFDVSRNYRDFAQQKARDAEVRLDFALGYLDESSKLLNRQFDLVFNRICWNYCIDDSSFATVIYSLVRPAGWAFVDTNHSEVGRESASASARVRTWLNDALGIKIGHPFPPRGRIEKLFRRFPHSELIAEYPPRNDRILFQRAGSAT